MSGFLRDLGPEDLRRAREAWRPGFGTYLRAHLVEGFDNTTIKAIADLLALPDRAEATATGTRDELADFPEGAVLETRPARGITREEHDRIVAGRPIPYDPFDTPERLKAKVEAWDERRFREWVIEKRRAGLFEGAAGFLAGMIGSLPDPINFVPLIGPTARAAFLARAGSRAALVARSALLGASEAAIATALTEPLLIGRDKAHGEDLDAWGVVWDLALGAGVGGVVGGAPAFFRRGPAPAGRLASTPEPDKLPVESEPAAAGDGRTVSPSLPDHDLGRRLGGKPAARFAFEAGGALRGVYVGEAMPARMADATEHALALGRAILDVARGEPADAAERPPRATWALPDRVVLPDGGEHPVVWRIVEADQLVTSHDDDLHPRPDYPAELQPRARERAASRAQIDRIAAELRPELLGPSVTATDGAPIVGPDLVVESGNGRVLALRRVYREHPERAAAYRRFLEGLGFDVRGKKAPVLVRVRIDELDLPARARFAVAANERTVAAMSATERARADAAALGPEMLSLLETRDFTTRKAARFVRAFFEKVASPSDLPELVTADGEISAAGVRRLEAALFYRAYGDARLLERLVESPDEDLGTLGKALEAVAPLVARWRAEIESGQAAAESDWLPDFLAAVRRIQDVRDRGAPLEEAVYQEELFQTEQPTALERAILTTLLKADRRGRFRVRTQQELEALLREWVEAARKQAPGVDMFGQGAADPLALLSAHGLLRPVRGQLVRAYDFDPDTWDGIDRALRKAQPFRDLDEAYRLAPRHQRELDRIGERIAGLELTYKGSLELRKTAEEKLARKPKYGGDPRMLTDIVRGMFVVETRAQVRRVVRELARHFGLIDEGLVIKPDGYADQKVLVRFEDGFLAEVQILHRAMAEAKTRGHVLYEKARVLPEDDPERARLEEERRVLYEAVRAGDSAFFTPASRPPAGAMRWRKPARSSAELTGTSSVEGSRGSIASSGASTQRAETTRPYSSVSSTRAATPSNRPSGESTRIAGETRSTRQSSTTTSPTPDTVISTRYGRSMDDLLLALEKVHARWDGIKYRMVPDVWRPLGDARKPRPIDVWSPIAERLARDPAPERPSGPGGDEVERLARLIDGPGKGRRRPRSRRAHG